MGYVPRLTLLAVFSFFLKMSLTFCFDTFRTRAVSRIPEAFAAMPMIRSSIPGFQPLHVYSRMEAGTQGRLPLSWGLSHWN